jgi:hypothetical protein
MHSHLNIKSVTWIFTAQCFQATALSQIVGQQIYSDAAQYSRRVKFWELTHFVSILMVAVEWGEYFNYFLDEDGR